VADFKTVFSQKRAAVEAHLRSLFESSVYPAQLKNSMRYSLLAGGKRLRPAIILIVDDIIRRRNGKSLSNGTGHSSSGMSRFSKTSVPHAGHSSDILNLAAALECVHTYSLIHDDLPAMDNDDLRRGKPTCHVKFGEAAAILAGDGLLTYAFEIVARLSQCRPKSAVKCAEILAQSAGPAGMVGGQILDLAAENTKISRAHLEKIHNLKTGRLFSAAFLLPLYYHGFTLDKPPGTQLISAFSEFAAHTGLLFQMTDDILDVTESSHTLGKNAGSDSKNSKSTYVSLLGLDGARKSAVRTASCAKKAIDKVSACMQKYDVGLLVQMTDYILERTA